MHDVAVGGQSPVIAEPGSATQEQARPVSPHELIWAIEAEAEGDATEAQLALLDAHRLDWRLGLQRLLRETEANLTKGRNLPGPARDPAVADFQDARSRLAEALHPLLGGTHAPVDDRPLHRPGQERPLDS